MKTNKQINFIPNRIRLMSKGHQWFRLKLDLQTAKFKSRVSFPKVNKNRILKPCFFFQKKKKLFRFRCSHFIFLFNLTQRWFCTTLAFLYFAANSKSISVSCNVTSHNTSLLLSKFACFLHFNCFSLFAFCQLLIYNFL